MTTEWASRHRAPPPVEASRPAPGDAAVDRRQRSAGAVTLVGEAASRGTTADHEWTPPTSRRQAEEAIDQLLTDIGIIQAQLAEPRDAWCERTGLEGEDHAAWRRRALFAKAYKESQLRQCKRLRQMLRPDGANDANDVQTLRRLSRAVVDAWEVRRAVDGWSSLEFAIAGLRRYVVRDDVSEGAEID